MSHLQEALSSKETELHEQLEELVRLRRAEGAHEQMELSEGKRLRALADQLICKCGAVPLVFCCLTFVLLLLTFRRLLQLLRV